MTLKAAWVPGLPHVLYPEKSSQWKKLNSAFQKLGHEIAAEKPDSLVVYSSQWLSVLGTSFQAHPEPKGVHVDENWYDLGDLPFHFRSDIELSNRFAKAVESVGYPTKTVNYEEFPIDTGTIVALRFLNPEGKIPVSVISSWVYANAEVSKKIGMEVARATRESGKKVVFIASSLLSTRFFTKEISPEADQVSSETDNRWNLELLEKLTSGNLKGACDLVPAMAKEVMTDMQFNALHWLSGVLMETKVRGEVLAYGPQWGTGASVVKFI